MCVCVCHRHHVPVEELQPHSETHPQGGGGDAKKSQVSFCPLFGWLMCVLVMVLVVVTVSVPVDTWTLAVSSTHRQTLLLPLP